MALLTTLSLMVQAPLPQGFAFLDRAPIRITNARMVAEAAVLGRPIDGAVGTDGRACVADRSNGQITCLAPSGAILWRAGRQGGGPGEFDRLYRLAMAADHGVLAFDLSNNRLTRFDATGRTEQTWQVPTSFRQVLTMLFLGDRDLLISGTLGGAPVSAGIHHYRFEGRTVEHVRSFGGLPLARDPRLIEHWGSGAMAAGLSGGFLYSLRLPYEITSYNRNGQESGIIRPTVKVPNAIDDVLQVQEGPDARSMQILDVPIPIPYRLHLLSPRLLLSHREVIHSGEVYWDFISLPGGETVAFKVPAGTGVGQVFGVDRDRGLLWALGTDSAGAPVVWRLQFEMR